MAEPMKVDHAFYVNIYGKGYSLLQITPLPSRLVDQLSTPTIPLKKDSSTKSVAYSATILPDNSVLISVYSYWSQLEDERGRAGLLFCHYIICPLNSRTDFYSITELMMRLVQGYTNLHDVIGEKIAKVATSSQSSGWEKELISLGEIPFSHESIDWVLNGFLLWLSKENPKKLNIYVDFPLDKLSSIPCLLHTLFNNDNVRHVGGGQLDKDSIQNYQAISVESEVPSFRLMKLSSIIGRSNDSREPIELPSKVETIPHAGYLADVRPKSFFERFFRWFSFVEQHKPDGSEHVKNRPDTNKDRLRVLVRRQTEIASELQEYYVTIYPDDSI